MSQPQRGASGPAAKLLVMALSTHLETVPGGEALELGAGRWSFLVLGH